MREVTKKEFFKVVGPLNVHLSHFRPEEVTWKHQTTRVVVGKSTPGYRNTGAAPHWFLVDDRTPDVITDEVRHN